MSDSLHASRLQQNTNLHHVRVYPRLRSTNAKAQTLLETGDLTLPAAVLASRQTAGRGQGGNTWWSDTGSLTVTFIIDAGQTPQPAQLPLRAGLAVRAAVIQHVAPHRVMVKWPNDVLVDGRKIAGILCQRVHEADLIGIGVNVTTNFAAAPPQARGQAASMSQCTAAPPTREQLFITLWQALESSLTDENWLDQLRRCDALRDRPVTVIDAGVIIHGTCRGIDAQGRLMIEHHNRIHPIITGHIIP